MQAKNANAPQAKAEKISVGEKRCGAMKEELTR